MIGLLVAFAVTAAVVGIAGRLPDDRKVKRTIATARLQPIDSVADGATVAIRGEVVLGAPEVEAPVSGRSCAYWVVVFEELGSGGDHRELGRAVGGQPFILRGEAASARVVPDDPRIAVPPVERVSKRAFDGALGALAKRVCRPMNYPHSSVWRATEFAVLPGMTVTVIGLCTLEPDPDAAGNVTGYREQLPARAVISGTRRQHLLIG